MKLTKNKPVILLVGMLTLLVADVTGQEEKDVPKEIVKLNYYNNNNSLQYLQLESILKTGKKLEPQKNKVFKLFLDIDRPENLITKVQTDSNGKAKAIIPVKLKTTWDSTGTHTFLVVAEATSKEEETTTEFTVTKSKITIDTSTVDSTRSISATVLKYENGQWVPAKDVEMKIGVQRFGGLLPAGDEDTYTSDSTGAVTAEFKRTGLPGDDKGNLVLAVKVEENDQLGNIIIEKEVPWGIASKTDNGFFNQRTLWSTRFKTPFWLLFMAYSIVVGVWGTIIYLVFQLVKIKKLQSTNL
jgi:hypothetical protein